MDLLDVTAVAEVTKLRRHHLYRLARQGMPHYRTRARVRFHLPEILEWMKAQASERLKQAHGQTTTSQSPIKAGEVGN